MKIYTVSFFGHRKIENLRELDNTLYYKIKNLISEHEFISFLVGRNGEFDECAASVIKRVQRELGKDCCELTLVLPYVLSNIEDYEAYYDCVLIPDGLSSKIYPKRAIGLGKRE